MLRLDRRSFAALPRPIYEIQAEWISSNDIRVTIMAGQGELSSTEEFPVRGTASLSHRLSSLLLGLPYFEHANAGWTDLNEKDGELYFATFSEKLALRQVLVGARSPVTRMQLSQALGDLAIKVEVFKVRPPSEHSVSFDAKTSDCGNN